MKASGGKHHKAFVASHGSLMQPDRLLLLSTPGDHMFQTRSRFGKHNAKTRGGKGDSHARVFHLFNDALVRSANMTLFRVVFVFVLFCFC
jgi:hypothetical protein